MNYFSGKNKKRNGGQIIIIAALFSVFISTVIVSAISSPVVGQLKTSRDLSKSKKSFFTAESGIEDVTYKIKNVMSVSPVETIYLNGGQSSVSVTDIDSNTKELLSAGDIDNRIRKIKNTINTTTGVSFNYGMFVGQGGINFDNNTQINGSVYSNGSLKGDSNVFINGDAYVAIQMASTTNTEWTINNDGFIFGRHVGSSRQIDAMQSFRPTKHEEALTKIALYLKKVGSPSNISVKITEGDSDKPDHHNVIASGVISSNLVGEDYSYVEVNFSNSDEIESDDLYWIVLDMVRDDDNYYVWGLDNNFGYEDGSAKYSSSWEHGSIYSIEGDLNFKVWAEDEDNRGSIDRVSVTGSAYANTITRSDVDGDVFASSFSDGTVGGNVLADSISNCTILGDAGYNLSSDCFVAGTETSPIVPPSDPKMLVFPISEANIDDWKNDAISAGIISNGDYNPPDQEIIGPGVIYGDLNIGSSKTVYLKGIVYVTGNIKVDNGAEINLDVFSNGSGLLFSEGWISLKLNVSVNMPKPNDNYLMLMSLSRCDDHHGHEHCTDEDASITSSNNVSANILAAPYGGIDLDNNVNVISLLGDAIKLHNNIILNYEEGLINMNFSAGPGGSWGVENWREVD